jgi:uncharacterized membrane protein
MSDLIVVGFHGQHRAAEVLNQLQEMHEDWTVDLEDGVAAYRRENGKLRIDQSANLTGNEGAGWGAVLGALVGAVLAAPFTAGASVAAAATIMGLNAATVASVGAVVGGEEAADWKDRYGVSDDFVQEVGGMIQPGDSAVFALIRTSDPDKVASHFAGYGGKILRTSLSPADEARLQRTIGK